MAGSLNLGKLKNLVKNGMSAIEKEEKSEEAVLVIGDTGVGKSTVINFLSGKNLYIKDGGLKTILTCQNESYTKIGHEKSSQTCVPRRVTIDNLAFYDCPGFRDNNGEENDISNTFFLQKLLQIYQRVKIILIIDESYITQCRAKKLPRISKNLLKSFKTFDQIKEGIVLIINKTDQELGIKQYGSEIKKMISLNNQNGPLFSQEQQMFFHHIINEERIILFKQPPKRDQGKLFSPRRQELRIIRQIKQCKYIKNKYKLNIVSESSQIAIRNHIDSIGEKTDKKIEKVCENIMARFMKMVEKENSAEELLKIKDKILKSEEEMQKRDENTILFYLKKQITSEYTQFQEDLQSLLLFKPFYNGCTMYIVNLKAKVSIAFRKILGKLDEKIIQCQKRYKLELEKTKIALRKEKMEYERRKQKLETKRQIKQIGILRSQISKMGNFVQNIFNSSTENLAVLKNLEEKIETVKVNTSRLAFLHEESRKEYINFFEARTYA